MHKASLAHICTCVCFVCWNFHSMNLFAVSCENSAKSMENEKSYANNNNCNTKTQWIQKLYVFIYMCVSMSLQKNLLIYAFPFAHTQSHLLLMLYATCKCFCFFFVLFLVYLFHLARVLSALLTYLSLVCVIYGPVAAAWSRVMRLRIFPYNKCAHRFEYLLCVLISRLPMTSKWGHFLCVHIKYK